MNNYPKYQYSRFIGADQIVVRCEDKEEFEILKKYVEGLGNVLPAKTPSTSPTPNVSVDDFEKYHKCPTHGTQMKERISKTKLGDDGKPLIYWDHRQQLPDGKWQKCFGKGWK